MMKFLSVAILCCLFISPLLSQERSAEENFYDALFFLEEEQDFTEAESLLKQVLEKEPENANAKFLLGSCYNQIMGQEYRGIPYLIEATENINLKYKEKKFAEKKAPYHTWFYLAEVYRKTNQMDEALAALKQFKSLPEFEKNYNVRITEDEIKSVERAKIIRDAELKLRALFFNEPINTTDHDYSGVISADGKMMIWVNTKSFYEAVYMSHREGDKWSIPALITPQIVSDGDLFPTGLSADGTMILAGYQNDTARLWDVSSAQLLREYKGDDSMRDPPFFRLSPDGSSLLPTEDAPGSGVRVPSACKPNLAKRQSLSKFSRARGSAAASATPKAAAAIKRNWSCM